MGIGKNSKRPSVNSTRRLLWSVRSKYSASDHEPCSGKSVATSQAYSGSFGRESGAMDIRRAQLLVAKPV